MPSGLNVLRALRAVRVFRLFRRLDPLKQILISLGYAVKPVASAALFVLLFSSLYAVVGVTFFREDFPELFGDFLRAQLTLMQIMVAPPALLFLQVSPSNSAADCAYAARRPLMGGLTA